MLAEMCHYANNMYNVALYNIRQYYFHEKKFLTYESNYHECKTNENYKLLQAGVAQQILKVADRSFKSFFNLVKKAKAGEYRFQNIKIPHYREKGGMFLLVLSTNAINIKDGFLQVPMSRAFSKLHFGKAIKIPFPERLSGKKIKEESPLTTQDLDTGFRVLKLDSTNMQDIYYSPKDISQADLFSQVDNVKPDRTGEDLLFQVMLELGATLDSKIETTTVAGKTIYNVAEGYLVACFDPDVTDDVVKAIAQMQPAYAVLRDTSMKDDSTATNFEQIFKTYSPDTVTKIL